MADPRTIYLDALQIFKEARNAFSQRLDPATRIASALARTWDVDFGEMPESTYPSVQDVIRRAQERPVIDLTRWPTADQIEAGVLDCRQKHDAMKAAWDSIPEQDRPGLEAPPQR